MLRRPADLVFWCLATLLVAMPLVLNKPGWPAGLKSDEPAYYLMALSLAKDGDLLCELGDIQRLFEEFPYHAVYNLILSTDDGWNTVYFGKPYVYSFFAAPMAGLFGASGMLAFNMALMLLMVWLGSRYLERRGNDPGLSLLFSFGFFFLSCGYSYIFWIHPEIFNMATVMVSLYFGLTEPTRQSWGPFARADFRHALSGAALILCVYNKPMLLALCLPPLVRALVRRRLRDAILWGVGAGLALLFTMGVALGLMGHPSAYLMARGGQKVCSDEVMPVQPVAPAPAPEVMEGPADGEVVEAPKKRPKASWYWLLRIPRPHPSMVIENLGNFLWGRHTGLFLYFPFAALTVLLFLGYRRRDLVAWATLLALATVAIYFLLWIPFNYQGGGGFVGNRYFVNAYPGFLFLVGTLAPRGITLVGYLLGGLLLGPILFSPFGRAVPAPTLQAHVRNFPYPYFPRELSLREVPGYEQRIWGGALVSGRSDVFLPRGSRFWAHGSTTTEVMIQSEARLESLAFDVVSLASPNRITLRLGDVKETFEVEGEISERGARRRVVLRPEEAWKRRRVKDTWVHVYRLEVEATRGKPRTWDRNFPPQDCFEFAYNQTIQESFYTGADIAFLGSAERLERDLYSVEWAEVEAPEPVPAGQLFTLDTTVTNRSDFPWPVEPPVRVALSYRFYDAAGEMVVANGLRTHPEAPVSPGETLALRQEVMAPEEPGNYTLELDLVYEMVAWFSDRNEGRTLRLPVEVTAPLETTTSDTMEATGDDS